MQGERYSLVCFVWPNDSTPMGKSDGKCDGTSVTFKEFMDVKSQGFALILSKSEELFEKVQGLNVALGMPTVTAAA